MTFQAKKRPSIMDVATWFLLKSDMTHKKVQKLCYYAEAWSEAILDAPISEDCAFEAWVHGPVNVTIWNNLKQYGWDTIEISDPIEMQEKLKGKFDADQLDILNQVWDVYGHYNAGELEGLTHHEKPWMEQRKGLSIFENCTKQISVQTMKDFYRAMADE